MASAWQQGEDEEESVADHPSIVVQPPVISLTAISSSTTSGSATCPTSNLSTKNVVRSTGGGRASAHINDTYYGDGNKHLSHNDNSKNSNDGLCYNVNERYEKIGRIGEGTYGVVYKARDRVTDRHVALKRCIPHNEASDGFPVTTLREIESLRLCASHPNIVHLETVAVSNTGVFLVFEYCEHDMSNLIDGFYAKYRCSPFETDAVKTLLYQLLDALDFVHAHHLLHRDLKVSNLLYSNSGMLKLADFGLSRHYSPPIAIIDVEEEFQMSNDGSGGAGIDGGMFMMSSSSSSSPPPASSMLTPNVASLWYRPPELFLGAVTYDRSIDMWAAGCIFAELLQGIPLMNGKDEMDQVSLLFRCLGVPRKQDWPEVQQLPLVQNGTINLSSAAAAARFMTNDDGRIRNSRYQRGRGGNINNPGRHLAAPATGWLLDEFGDILSGSGLQLLTKLLQYAPYKRWTARQALESSFFVEAPVPLDVDRMPKFPSSSGQRK